MIRVTRMNNTPFVLNAELIETVDATPDTLVTLTTHQKILVRESVDEVMARAVEYRRAVAHPASCLPVVRRNAEEHQSSD